ncbi:hypothetical protein AB4Z35_27210 [Pseudomonas sp. KB_15]|uniref:hypothetical protein n=1 Tax=Pseudomonas sp. KB_15 TaxID=3233035 RepID=UPI003F99640A
MAEPLGDLAKTVTAWYWINNTSENGQQLLAIIYRDLHGTALGTLQAVLSGRFNKNDFVLLQVLKP